VHRRGGTDSLLVRLADLGHSHRRASPVGRHATGLGRGHADAERSDLGREHRGETGSGPRSTRPNLPEYAGRLFDRYQSHPEVQRLATWYRLERADNTDPIEAIVASNAANVKAIAPAQVARQAHAVTSSLRRASSRMHATAPSATVASPAPPSVARGPNAVVSGAPSAVPSGDAVSSAALRAASIAARCCGGDFACISVTESATNGP
jgi:hypothetical protein